MPVADKVNFPGSPLILSGAIWWSHPHKPGCPFISWLILLPDWTFQESRRANALQIVALTSSLTYLCQFFNWLTQARSTSLMEFLTNRPEIGTQWANKKSKQLCCSCCNMSSLAMFFISLSMWKTWMEDPVSYFPGVPRGNPILSPVHQGPWSTTHLLCFCPAVSISSHVPWNVRLQRILYFSSLNEYTFS